MNPLYAAKKIREELTKNSAKAYGTRNEWRKRADKYGLSIGEINQIMIAMISLERNIINELRQDNRQAEDSEATEAGSEEVRPEQAEDGVATAGGDE